MSKIAIRRIVTTIYSDSTSDVEIQELTEGLNNTKVKNTATLSKEALNKKLNDIASCVSNQAIVEASMIGAKWVEVKSVRHCRCCKATIKAKTLAMTASNRDAMGFKQRQYVCNKCSESELNKLLAIDMRLENECDYNIDYADGYSSMEIK